MKPEITTTIAEIQDYVLNDGSRNDKIQNTLDELQNMSKSSSHISISTVLERFGFEFAVRILPVYKEHSTLWSHFCIDCIESLYGLLNVKDEHMLQAVRSILISGVRSTLISGNIIKEYHKLKMEMVASTGNDGSLVQNALRTTIQGLFWGTPLGVVLGVQRTLLWTTRNENLINLDALQEWQTQRLKHLIKAQSWKRTTQTKSTQA